MDLLTTLEKMEKIEKEKKKKELTELWAEAIAALIIFVIATVAFKFAFDATWWQSLFVSWVIHIIRDTLQTIAKRVK